LSLQTIGFSEGGCLACIPHKVAVVAAFIVASPIVASVHTAGLSQPAGKLSITVSGACNSDGVVRCALFNSPAAFPKIGQEWRGVIAPIRGGAATQRPMHDLRAGDQCHART